MPKFYVRISGLVEVKADDNATAKKLAATYNTHAGGAYYENQCVRTTLRPMLVLW